MGTYTKIPQATFDELQLEAGVLLKTFDLSNPTITDTAIVTATTGGFQISASPTFSDLGEDVDNCPENTKELKHLDSWEVTASTTALGTSTEVIKLALGVADIDSNDATKVTPRRDLKQSDFRDLWWVGDRADGGFVAVKLLNVLSTGGLSLQTSKNSKGQISLSLTTHISITNQDVIPVEFYSVEA